MKTYKLLTDIWVKGIQKPAGGVISMLEVEAKYLKHALEEVVAEVENEKVSAPVAPKAPAAPAAPVAPAAPAAPAPTVTPAIGASVQEAKSAQ